MKFSSLWVLGATTFILSFSAGVNPVFAEQWYFWVQNNTDTGIKEIQVSQNKKTWGYFKIGKGVAPGQKMKIEWDESTNNESCDQWIKAKFYDGEETEPSKINFCEDLNTPIVFE